MFCGIESGSDGSFTSLSRFMMLSWEGYRSYSGRKADVDNGFTFSSCFMILPWADFGSSLGIEADLDDYDMLFSVL